MMLKIYISILLFFQSIYNSNHNSLLTYSKGDTLEIVIPRVFDEKDIGKAYPKFITGLKGDRQVNSKIITTKDTIINQVFKQVEDGLILNAWGTGLGMYDRGIEVNTDIRRARFALMKVFYSKKLEKAKFDNLHASKNPMLLIAIDYGYSFNLSISGKKDRFTQKVFDLLENRIDNQQPINDILKEHELTSTFAFRGISPKTGEAAIPTTWDELESNYNLNQKTAVFGKYVLLDQIDAEKIDWLEE